MSSAVNFIINNYTEETLQQLEDLFSVGKAQYILFSKENAPATNTPRLRGYIQFKRRTRFVSLSKKLKGTLEAARRPLQQNQKMLKKEGNYFEMGEAIDHSYGIEEKRKFANACKQAKKTHVEISRSEIETVCSETKGREYMPAHENLDQLENLWIWGPAGVGKSYWVRERYGHVYPKMVNKWWDCYNGEETVVIDSVSPYDAYKIANKLKAWTDHYPFIGEMKGECKMIRPKRIIVTSNYSMEEVFQNCPTELLSLKRKIHQVHMLGPFQTPDLVA